MVSIMNSNTLFYISKNDWEGFLKSLFSQYEIFAPIKKEDDVFWQETDKQNLSHIVYGLYRTSQPLKTFFYQFMEKVSPSSCEMEKSRIILGAKSCDIEGIKVLDKIFLDGDIVDPFYEKKRKKTILITTDCMEAKDVCFCVLAGYNPFSKEGFDINLTPFKEGFLVEKGSSKGEELVSLNPDLYKSVSVETAKERNSIRDKVIDKVKQVNKEFKYRSSISDIIKENYKHPAWREESETCVSCGACTNICPSCNCFLLADIPDKEMFLKLKYWDTCQYAGFARVAGGANPRRDIYERFRNRYLCKYNYKPDVLNKISCTGCGRCIEACAGKIDMRKVIYRLQTKV